MFFSDGWHHYWTRALLLLLAAGGITLIAGAIAWATRAFALDRDDIRNHPESRTPMTQREITLESWALDSQEPVREPPQ